MRSFKTEMWRLWQKCNEDHHQNITLWPAQNFPCSLTVSLKIINSLNSLGIRSTIFYSLVLKIVIPIFFWKLSNHQFDLSYVTDPIHYVIYPEDGGHLDWHLDIGIGEVNRRKLSLTVQLSDPSEYEGGEFEIWYGHSGEFVELPRKKGDVIIFPSFLMHRVKPITRGQRKALVFWTGGEPFK
jgi:hypothetical protein